MTLAQNLQIHSPDNLPGSTAPAQFNITGPLQNINNITDLINILMKFVFPFAAVILFFVIIAGGFDLLTSRGEPEKVKSGQQKITAGIIGFVLLVLSLLASQILGFIFGVGEGIL